MLLKKMFCDYIYSVPTFTRRKRCEDKTEEEEVKEKEEEEEEEKEVGIRAFYSTSLDLQKVN